MSDDNHREVMPYPVAAMALLAVARAMSSEGLGRLNDVAITCGGLVRNPALDPLDLLVGEWTLVLTDAWFLESPDVRQHGHAVARWLGEAFIEIEAELEGEPVWHFVLGRSDAHEQLVALYHDPRPTSRLFQMTFAGEAWTLHREDPDFHQRFIARVGPDRIDGHWDASEDHGESWRKDFDLIFERTASHRGG